ncbi:MAG: septum formation protein Maf [Candidatus Rokubacteria bacterium]|nr:septum formation protein Maf [Candidatus Rokubacteria bacterium]
MRLVLASASPRRRELLAGLGLAFDVVPSTVEESLSAGVPIPGLATRLALAKARDVAGRVGPAIVLAADTLVVLGGVPFGKPASPEEARRMLTALRGRAHDVVTAVAVVEAGARREATATVVSRVVMRAYTATELETYLATSEPYDKAGAYAVQGEGGRLVERVEGCYTNVVGLPVTTTARLLRAFGLPAPEPPR